MHLCHNAQVYNKDHSLIYAHSVELQTVFKNIRQNVESENDSDNEEDTENKSSKYLT